MRYDPTLRSLFFPETGAPVDDFGTDWELDQVCAELCRLVYIPFEKGDEARLQAILTNAGFSGPAQCFHDGRTGAQAFAVLGPDGTAYVAYRGTKITSLKDLIADLSPLPVRWHGAGRVHLGFWRCCRALRPAVEAWLADTPHDRLVLTGHSLGAAMATLMAALRPEAELVTFGSPRVGSPAFVASLAGRSLRRYVDCVDGVPRLPPPVGYDHAGEMIYLDRLGQLHSPPPGEAALRADRREARRRYRREHAWRWGSVPTRSGADHAPVNYISALLGRRRP
jgi:pimeloyl-ACP methyl ester carboxylesterase